MPAAPDQLTKARRLLGLTILETSKAAGILPSTMSRIETGLNLQKLTRYALRQAFVRTGVVFGSDDTAGSRDGR
jgi:transcriptional regulator with XRE-family HTH domain